MRVKAYLELAPRLVAFVGGLAYLSGLVVLHTHLQRFGANTLGFFAPQYVAAGAWALIFTAYFALLGGLLGAFLSLLGVERKRSSTNGKVRARLLTFVLIPLSMASTIVGFLFPAAMGLAMVDVAPDTQWLWVGAGPAYVGFNAMVVARSAIDGSERGRAPRSRLAVYLIALATLLFLYPMYLVMFAWQVYPSIPARWGGGETVPARVVVSASDAERLRAANLLDDQTQAAITGQLVLLTDDDLILVPDSHPSAVVLRRSGVLALVLQPGHAPKAVPTSSKTQVRTDSSTPHLSRWH